MSELKGILEKNFEQTIKSIWDQLPKKWIFVYNVQKDNREGYDLIECELFLHADYKNLNKAISEDIKLFNNLSNYVRSNHDEEFWNYYRENQEEVKDLLSLSREEYKQFMIKFLGDKEIIEEILEKVNPGKNEFFDDSIYVNADTIPKAKKIDEKLIGLGLKKLFQETKDYF